MTDGDRPREDDPNGRRAPAPGSRRGRTTTWEAPGPGPSAISGIRPATAPAARPSTTTRSATTDASPIKGKRNPLDDVMKPEARSDPDER